MRLMGGHTNLINRKILKVIQFIQNEKTATECGKPTQMGRRDGDGQK